MNLISIIDAFKAIILGKDKPQKAKKPSKRAHKKIRLIQGKAKR
jgi:hypothetical protein